MAAKTKKPKPKGHNKARVETIAEQWLIAAAVNYGRAKKDADDRCGVPGELKHLKSVLLARAFDLWLSRNR